MLLKTIGQKIKLHQTARRLQLRPLLLPKNDRMPELDFLRGFCVILMVLDHLCFDIMWLPHVTVNFFHAAPAFLVRLYFYIKNVWWGSAFRTSARLCVVSLFFCISGICTAFSRNNVLRGIKPAVAAVFLSFVTLVADDLFGVGIGIVFGVLHCLAVSVFIFVLLDLLTKEKAPCACLVLGLFLVVWGLMNNFHALENTAADLDGKYLGFVDFLRVAVGTRVYGSDCAGLLPYAGIFLIGAAGGKLLYADKRSKLPLLGKRPFAPVNAVGRHALIVYLVHQPILLAILLALFAALGVRFSAF